ncbi:MAG: hypothetical protein ABI644_08070 [Arenimonas sp.]
MDKHDPNIDWQDLNFRRRSRISQTATDHRFAIGLGVFILVALLFPWYAYEVVSYSLERDTTRALNQFGIETQKQIEEANKESQKVRAATADYQLRQRIAGVRVMGVSSGGDFPTVLVSLGNSNIYEADIAICKQAASWLGRNVAGATLRIQKHRGKQPAQDAGEITCP